MLLLALLACDRSNDANTRPEPQLVGAPGVTITEVAFYQGPEITLAEDGESQDASYPLVAGRDALIRVFYESDDEGVELVGRLELEDGTVLEAQMDSVDESKRKKLETTLNFTVPGELIEDTFAYRVSILAEGKQDNDDAHFPLEGFDEHDVTGEPTVFRITIVPFQYNADGSGRIPDISAEAVAAYEERFRQLYPLADVELTIHDVVPWSGRIDPDGSGWQEIGFQLFGLRAQSADDDEYYYGMFTPRDSLGQFCQSGCLLGVTLLNDNPSDVGDPRLRLGIGVGFPEVATDTMLHELGHAHGREHADCGYGIDPGSIDPDFPNDDGEVDDIIYDFASGELLTSGLTDLMGYCDDQWTSGYTYSALHTRMVNIQNEGRRSEGLDLDVLLVDGHGGVSWGGSSQGLHGGGEPVQALLDGEPVAGSFYRYDHLPGGWLVLDAKDARQVRFALDGVEHRGTLNR